MKRYFFATIFLLLIIIVVILIPRKPSHQSSPITSTADYEYYYNKEPIEEEESLLPPDLTSILDNTQTVPLDTNPKSLTVLVNRYYLLSSDYTPKNLIEPNVKFNFNYAHDKRMMQQTAAHALEKLFNAAEKKGHDFYGVSGYRSYARQLQIYNNNIATRGVTATDSVSAKPGSSEHQTGLAMDISIKSIGCHLDQALGRTPEGKWLAANCHEFGFIIRYPKGKDDITGYTYEPWHIRYVGTRIATYLYKNNLTLEEYYGCTSNINDNYTTGVDVEDANNVTFAKPTPKPKATNIPASTTPKATRTPKPKTTKKSTPKPRPTKKPVPTHKPPVKTSKPVTTQTPKLPTATPNETPSVTE